MAMSQASAGTNERNDAEGKSVPSVGMLPQNWESDADPLNPLNWSKSRKWSNLALITMQAILSPIASTILAIGAEEIAKNFKLTSAFTPVLPTALYVLGIGMGPLVLAPCSELYGRRIVYLISFACFTAINIGCVFSPNITTLSILRFLSGIAGSAGPSISSGSVGDMFSVAKRGRAQAIVSTGPVFGPVIGGIIGGFIVYYTGGWRWLIGTVAIASGFTMTLSFFFLHESYGPYILSRKLTSPDNGDPRNCYAGETPSLISILAHSISRPVRMLISSPILAFIAIYQSLIYGILYLHLLTILLLFGPDRLHGLFSYQWTNGKAGLAYLGAGTGAMAGVIVTAKFMNRSLAAAVVRQERYTGISTPTPEMRLPFLRLGMIIVPLGLIIFAWSAGKTHWIVPLIGACIFGLGMVMGYVCIQAYLVDCFGRWSASALAAVIIVRCPLTCIFCIFGFELYRDLGYAWGSMLLSFLCIAMIPIPFALEYFGPYLRATRIKP